MSVVVLPAPVHEAMSSKKKIKVLRGVVVSPTPMYGAVVIEEKVLSECSGVTSSCA